MTALTLVSADPAFARKPSSKSQRLPASPAASPSPTLSSEEILEFAESRQLGRDYEGLHIRREQQRELKPAIPARGPRDAGRAPHPLPSDAVPESKIQEFVVHWTTRKLTLKKHRGSYRKQAPKVAQSILDESRRYGFDPVFLMAVIEHESRFEPRARGRDGEIGLMQLMPETGRWMAAKLDIPWKGERTLRDPVLNVRIGSALLADLRKHFRKNSPLYIAAYNMGAGNVHDLMEQKIRPREYSSKVMREYLRLEQELRRTLPASARFSVASEN